MNIITKTLWWETNSRNEHLNKNFVTIDQLTEWTFTFWRWSSWQNEHWNKDSPLAKATSRARKRGTILAVRAEDSLSDVRWHGHKLIRFYTFSQVCRCLDPTLNDVSKSCVHHVCVCVCVCVCKVWSILFEVHHKTRWSSHIENSIPSSYVCIV